MPLLPALWKMAKNSWSSLGTTKTCCAWHLEQNWSCSTCNGKLQDLETTVAELQVVMEVFASRLQAFKIGLGKCHTTLWRLEGRGLQVGLAVLLVHMFCVFDVASNRH